MTTGSATIRVELPGMLADLLHVPRAVTVEGETLGAALGALVAAHPGLAVHLFDESGGLRPHVLCFHNGVNTRWIASSAEMALGHGDTITFMQAVSGG